MASSAEIQHQLEDLRLTEWTNGHAPFPQPLATPFGLGEGGGKPNFDLNGHAQFQTDWAGHAEGVPPTYANLKGGRSFQPGIYAVRMGLLHILDFVF